MKRDIKTILIGLLSTILVLVLAIFILYFIADNKSKAEINDYKPEDKPAIKEEPVNEEKVDESIKNEVTIYLFRGEGCPHCENALEYFKTLIDKYPYLKVKSLEVWRNEDNKNFLESIASTIGLEKTTSVPIIVIGSNYHKIGFGVSSKEEINSIIEKEYHNKNYKDIIGDALKLNEYNTKIENIKD